MASKTQLVYYSKTIDNRILVKVELKISSNLNNRVLCRVLLKKKKKVLCRVNYYL